MQNGTFILSMIIYSISLRDSAERGNDTSVIIATMLLLKTKDFWNENFQICGLCIKLLNFSQAWENTMSNKLNLHVVI